MNPLTIEPTEFQRHVLSVPMGVDIVLAGGRGGGKTYSVGLLCLQHVEAYGPRASILVTRRDWSGLRELWRTLNEILTAAYGDGLRANIKDKIFETPGGGIVELQQALTLDSSYAKLHGRSFSMLVLEEATQHYNFELMDAMRGNIRAPAGVETRTVWVANPGGALHRQFQTRFIDPLKPWKISSLPGVSDAIVLCPSTFRDNDRINRDAYERSLEQAVGKQPGLLKAWRDGEWSGALSNLFFEGHWREDKNVLAPLDEWPAGFRPFLSLDWGSLRPCYVGLYGQARTNTMLGNVYVPAKSIVQFDEFTTARGESLNEGDGSTPEEVSSEVARMWEHWSLAGKPAGVADDACWIKTAGRSQPSIADLFGQSGVRLIRASKGQRRGGWEILKQMMAHAHDDSGKPAFFVAANCEYQLSTTPFLPRDSRRQDDLDTNGPDHGADSARFACLGQRAATTPRRIRTLYDSDPTAAAFARLDQQVKGEVRV